MIWKAQEVIYYRSIEDTKKWLLSINQNFKYW